MLMMIRIALLLILLPAVQAAGQTERIRVGKIEYFGTQGVDLAKVKTALPIHEGEQVSLDPDLLAQIKTSIKESTGNDPTDVNPVCCDSQNNWMIYVGLRGENLESFQYNRPPTSAIHFPTQVVLVYREAMDLLRPSIEAHTNEDRSRGYALSEYPPLRAKQLAMREYAVHHAALIRQIASTSADPEQRTVAAQLLGYVNHNQLQILSLVKASRDSDDGVRNNAVRALGVLAESNPVIAKKISAEEFMAMLNSGSWRDRNKGSYLLGVLSVSRRPALLSLLRRRALTSLIEMARWREYGHASSARLILGRIAGLEESKLRQMAVENVQLILNAFTRP
jgi:hypothetical protein